MSTHHRNNRDTTPGAADRSGRLASSASQAEAAELVRFEPATSELLSARALQRRVDSKFITQRERILPLLRELGDDFTIAMSGDHRLGTYETLYFDTPQLDFFHQHRRGRRPRHKVRIRRYVERDLCFLETKTKDRCAVMTRHRFPHGCHDFDLGPSDIDTIQRVIGEHGPLSPSARVEFGRVTLLGVSHPERLTIDLGIVLQANERQLRIARTSIIEVKQPRFDARSPAFLALRRLAIRRHRISKYCVALTATGVVPPVGRFLTALRRLQGSNHA